MGKKTISDADQEVLAEIVKVAQKQGLQGNKGGWSDFLICHVEKLGTSLRDPTKRTRDTLIAFLQTFPEERQKYFDKLAKRFKNELEIRRFTKDFPELQSPQQKLVLLTMQHPKYIQEYSFPFYNEGWVITRLGKASKALQSQAMIAIDCEMVLCQDGTEAVVKICVVDHNLEVKLDSFVKPNKAVDDYRTHITGVSPKDIEDATCSLSDVQKSLKKLLSHGTILVGHSLYNDLRALKLDHLRIIDTSYIFKYADLPDRSPSLNNLCKAVLGVAVREEAEPHNCLNDARAAMKLALAKLEHGFHDPITVAAINPSESDLAKLFLHRIPVNVPSHELIRLFLPRDDVQIETDLRIRGRCYSTLAVFKDAREADEAFKELEGHEMTDSIGRPQKNVFLKLSTERGINFVVRKMIAVSNCKNMDSSKKRSYSEITEDNGNQEAGDAAAVSKRQMVCDNGNQEAGDAAANSKRQMVCDNGNQEVGHVAANTKGQMVCDNGNQEAGDAVASSKGQLVCMYPCYHSKKIEMLKQEVHLLKNENLDLRKKLSDHGLQY